MIAFLVDPYQRDTLYTIPKLDSTLPKEPFDNRSLTLLGRVPIGQGHNQAKREDHDIE